MRRGSTVLAAYGFIAVLLAVVTGVSAQGVSTLTTPPLFVVAGDSIACEVANLAGRQVWVTTSVINGAGTTVASNTVFLAAGASTETDFAVPDSGNDRFYCKFECATGCDLRAALARFTAGSDVAGYPATSSP